MATLPLQIAAQEMTPRPLGRATAEFSGTFSQINGLRELKDGRVVVSDARERTLQLVDFASGAAGPISRIGSGPNEWQNVLRVLAGPGDSTTIVDRMNARFLVLDPSGKPIRTYMPEIALTPTTTADGRPIRSMGGGPALGVRMIDTLGRSYVMGVNMLSGAPGATRVDTVPLIRKSATRQDTIAWLRLHDVAPQRPPETSGGQHIVFGSTPLPFAAGDAWVAFPDGRVVIARSREYRVDVIYPDGRRVVGRAIPHTPVRITSAEREEWLTTEPPGMVSVNMSPGGGVSTSSAPPPKFRRQEPSSWPERKPPFVEDGIWSAPRGEAWVLRSRAANDSTPVFDVFDAKGELTRRVALPKGARIAGFGAASVYVIRTDDDGLEHLARYQI